jgi:hypothetical protein
MFPLHKGSRGFALKQGSHSPMGGDCPECPCRAIHPLHLMHPVAAGPAAPTRHSRRRAMQARDAKVDGGGVHYSLCRSHGVNLGLALTVCLDSPCGV